MTEHEYLILHVDVKLWASVSKCLAEIIKKRELKRAAQSCLKLTDLFKKAKLSAEVAEEPGDKDTSNTAKSEG